jgi:hypothetical protein
LERCTLEHYLVKPSQIHYLRFILEAYEGIATMTTRDPSLGWVQLNIAPGCESEVRQVLDSEKERLELRKMVVREV